MQDKNQKIGQIMKVLISTVVMVLVAVAIIYKMVTSTQESVASMDVVLERHFSLIQAGNYRETYEKFHKDLQQRISPDQYESVWRERITQFGPLESWEIYTSNKSSNLFTGEKEYDVILSLRYASGEELIRKVYHIWKIEEGEPKLIYSGRRSTASDSSNFEVF